MIPKLLQQPQRVNLMSHWYTIMWVCYLAWSTAANLLSAFLVTTLLGSLLPAAIALTGRGLLNALVAGAQQGNDNLSSLLPWLALGATLTVSNAIIVNLGDYWRQRLQDEINLRVVLDVLSQADRLDLAFLESSEAQDRLERARKYGNGLVAQVFFALVTIANQSVRICTLVGILIWIEPLIVGWLLLLALLYLPFKWRLAQHSYVLQHRRTHKQRWVGYFTHLLTNLRWLPEVKFFRLGPLFIERFRKMNAEFLVEDRQLYQLALQGNAIFAIVGALGLYVLLVRIAQRVVASALTIGDVAIYTSGTLQLQSAVQSLVQTSASLNEHLLYVGDLQAFLALQLSSPESKGQSPEPAAIQQQFPPPRCQPAASNRHGGYPTVDGGLRIPNARRGVIEFENVSFTYPGRDQPALSQLSFRLEPGETVALVGENGAGKSTLAKLLARLYEPSAGCIRFAGTDLREFDRSDWQQQIGFVFQNLTFYEATARENIAYGNWPALNQQPTEVERIAHLTQVDSFIGRLAQGYDTLLGRHFGNHELSIGQWQRLAVARGLARPDALVLILDEPSASLDVRAEYELFCHFRQAAAGRTTLLISHRFSTISMADRILTLEKGRLAEYGTHRELLAQDGQYATLYRLYQQQTDVGRER